MTDAKASSSTLGRSAAKGPRLSAEEAGRLGSEIYERDIKAQVEADHDGEVVAIDLDSGDWAISESVMAASDLLRDKRPAANDVFFERVGYHAVVSLGGGPRRRTNERSSMKDAKTPSDTVRLGAARGPNRSAKEIARLAKEIYERDIKAQVVADHDGEVVAIDVDSGDWAIAKDSMGATDRLRARQPYATDVFCERVGYRTMHSFAGGLRRRTD